MPFDNGNGGEDVEEFFTRRGGGRRIAPPRVIPRPRRVPLTPPRPPKGAIRSFVFNKPERLIPMRPNDERGFIHKKLLRVVGGLGIPVVSTAAQIGSALVSRGRPTPPRTATARVNELSINQTRFAKQVKFESEPTFQPRRIVGGRSGPCDFPMVTDSAGRCRMPTSGATGGEQFGVGEAVMGRYGAALEPGSMIVDRAVCLRGMQLADDGLCYNKSQISNKQRMWPAGRKPLLSGGDMRAIGIAARAGRRLEGATKRLKRLGMMKASPVRRAPAAKGKALVLKEAGPGGITVQ